MPKNLLLADDSITIQKVVGITFANEDFKVTSAANGEEALAKARELRPDVILADVVMPRKNGYELCEAVKADPALRHIPVLLLAGTFEAFDESRARQARADGHVSKPFDSGTLIAKVKELVDGRSAPGAAVAAPRPAAPAQPQPQRPAGAPLPPAGARPARSGHAAPGRAAPRRDASRRVAPRRAPARARHASRRCPPARRADADWAPVRLAPACRSPAPGPPGPDVRPRRPASRRADADGRASARPRHAAARSSASRSSRRRVGCRRPVPVRPLRG
jgi:CheY-like chemotaxis protein